MAPGGEVGIVRPQEPRSWERRRCAWAKTQILDRRQRLTRPATKKALRTNKKADPTVRIKAPPPSPTPPAEVGPVKEDKPARYETLVPMRGIDEWALWSFLESKFGENNFNVVVSSPFETLFVVSYSLELIFVSNIDGTTYGSQLQHP